uniref:Uncharacterized protein n=1 Tax=Heliothis virescens TaxID=7102 RepID=A0A2A4JCH2_HELVI
MEEKPDEPEDVTNKPLPSMSEPTEVQEAVASTIATPFAQPIIAASKSKAQKQREYRQRVTASRTPAQAAAARKSKNERQRKNRSRQAAASATPFAEPIAAAPKTRAQIQREYRQRIAASKTPAQAAAAREARNVRDRNNRLRKAANLVIASSLEATTTSQSRLGQRLNTVHIATQRQTDQQRQFLATEPAEITVQPNTSSDEIEVQAQSTWHTEWSSSITQLPRPRAPRKIPQITPNCPQCYADLPMTTIARDERVRLVIAKVYQFLEEEYDELKCIYPNTDLFMLSEFSRRTAAATGVTEDLVQEILGEEAVRSAAAEPPPAKRARTAEDGSIDDDVDDVEGNMYIDDSEEQTEEIVQVMKGPSVYMNNVPMLEIKPLIGFEEETLIIKEETEMDTMDVPKQEPPDELHSEYINVNNTATDVSSDEAVRRDKQKTISEPTGHVSTTYVYNRVTDVSIDEVVRREKQKITSEPTAHVSTEDPLLITEVKQEDLDIKEEGIS